MRILQLNSTLQWSFIGNVLSNALATGDVDEDGCNEFVIGNTSGDMAIFKGRGGNGRWGKCKEQVNNEHDCWSEVENRGLSREDKNRENERIKPTRGKRDTWEATLEAERESRLPWAVAHNLGTISTIAIGDVLNTGKTVIVVVNGEGKMYLFQYPFQPDIKAAELQRRCRQRTHQNKDIVKEHEKNDDVQSKVFKPIELKKTYRVFGADDERKSSRGKRNEKFSTFRDSRREDVDGAHMEKSKRSYMESNEMKAYEKYDEELARRANTVDDKSGLDGIPTSRDTQRKGRKVKARWTPLIIEQPDATLDVPINVEEAIIGKYDEKRGNSIILSTSDGFVHVYELEASKGSIEGVKMVSKSNVKGKSEHKKRNKKHQDDFKGYKFGGDDVEPKVGGKSDEQSGERKEGVKEEGEKNEVQHFLTSRQKKRERGVRKRAISLTNGEKEKGLMKWYTFRGKSYGKPISESFKYNVNVRITNPNAGDKNSMNTGKENVELPPRAVMAFNGGKSFGSMVDVTKRLERYSNKGILSNEEEEAKNRKTSMGYEMLGALSNSQLFRWVYTAPPSLANTRNNSKTHSRQVSMNSGVNIKENYQPESVLINQTVREEEKGPNTSIQEGKQLDTKEDSRETEGRHSRRSKSSVSEIMTKLIANKEIGRLKGIQNAYTEKEGTEKGKDVELKTMILKDEQGRLSGFIPAPGASQQVESARYVISSTLNPKADGNLGHKDNRNAELAYGYRRDNATEPRETPDIRDMRGVTSGNNYGGKLDIQRLQSQQLSPSPLYALKTSSSDSDANYTHAYEDRDAPAKKKEVNKQEYKHSFLRAKDDEGYGLKDKVRGRRGLDIGESSAYSGEVGRYTSGHSHIYLSAGNRSQSKSKSRRLETSESENSDMNNVYRVQRKQRSREGRSIGSRSSRKIEGKERKKSQSVVGGIRKNGQDKFRVKYVKNWFINDFVGNLTFTKAYPDSFDQKVKHEESKVDDSEKSENEPKKEAKLMDYLIVTKPGAKFVSISSDTVEILSSTTGGENKATKKDVDRNSSVGTRRFAKQASEMGRADDDKEGKESTVPGTRTEKGETDTQNEDALSRKKISVLSNPKFSKLKSDANTALSLENVVANFGSLEKTRKLLVGETADKSSNHQPTVSSLATSEWGGVSKNGSEEQSSERSDLRDTHHSAIGLLRSKLGNIPGAFYDLKEDGSENQGCALTASDILEEIMSYAIGNIKIGGYDVPWLISVTMDGSISCYDMVSKSVHTVSIPVLDPILGVWAIKFPSGAHWRKSPLYDSIERFEETSYHNRVLQDTQAGSRYSDIYPKLIKNLSHNYLVFCTWRGTTLFVNTEKLLLSSNNQPKPPKTLLERAAQLESDDATKNDERDTRLTLDSFIRFKFQESVSAFLAAPYAPVLGGPNVPCLFYVDFKHRVWVHYQLDEIPALDLSYEKSTSNAYDSRLISERRKWRLRNIRFHRHRFVYNNYTKHLNASNFIATQLDDKAVKNIDKNETAKTSAPETMGDDLLMATGFQSKFIRSKHYAAFNIKNRSPNTNKRSCLKQPIKNSSHRAKNTDKSPTPIKTFCTTLKNSTTLMSSLSVDKFFSFDETGDGSGEEDFIKSLQKEHAKRSVFINIVPPVKQSQPETVKSTNGFDHNHRMDQCSKNLLFIPPPLKTILKDKDRYREESVSGSDSFFESDTGAVVPPYSETPLTIHSATSNSTTAFESDDIGIQNFIEFIKDDLDLLLASFKMTCYMPSLISGGLRDRLSSSCADGDGEGCGLNKDIKNNQKLKKLVTLAKNHKINPNPQNTLALAKFISSVLYL